MNRYLFDSPAIYQICVHGRVQQNWSDRLEGMRIINAISEDGALLSTLTGELTDQAALQGVINTLYELHLPVLLVERLTEPETTPILRGKQ